MADEIKKEDETVTPEEPEKDLEQNTDEESNPEEKSEGEDKSKTLQTNIDYKAELEAERKRAFQEGFAAAAFKKREDKRKSDPEEEVEEEEDKPLTKKELEEVLLKERQETQKQIQETRIREIARSLSKSEEEADFIVEIHKNRGFPSSLSLEEQLSEAHAIANKKRLIVENSELKRSLQKNPNTSFEGSHPDSTLEEPKMSQADIMGLKQAGFIWDSKIGKYKKQLPSKKFLYYDPKTKQQTKQ